MVYDYLVIFADTASEATLRLFENMEPRKLFGPEMQEVITRWIKLHSEKFRNLYFLLNIIRMTK
jgi:hypothetical protein